MILLTNSFSYEAYKKMNFLLNRVFEIFHNKTASIERSHKKEIEFIFQQL
ncbi:hypothetical protein LEP1GSC041_3953 [Leptospira noguchii str. 2006001870]|nr:hypothetical protein LEP1GSC041_3953 [Leptospira noguchii str. 2006001870]